MLSSYINEAAIPCGEWSSELPIGYFTRCAVAGQIRGASCVTLACVPPECELLIKTNLASAEGGGARRSFKAASQTARVRHRRLPSGFISIAELAARAAAAPSTAYTWVENGKLPASRWRGMLIVAEPDADDFLAVKPLRPAIDDAEEARHG